MTCERGEFIAWRRGGRAERARKSALRRVAARPQMAATGHPEDMANLMRRTLIRTNAPILSSCKRMEPHATDGVNIAQTTNEC